MPVECMGMSVSEFPCIYAPSALGTVVCGIARGTNWYFNRIHTMKLHGVITVTLLNVNRLILQLLLLTPPTHVYNNFILYNMYMHTVLLRVFVLCCHMIISYYKSLSSHRVDTLH